MKNKRLYVLAPNDRFNYGDLLFPYVLTSYFKKYFDDIVYVSTTKSDLSSKGGFPTLGYSALFNVDETWENHLIVAGGESLCVRWYVILSYIYKNVDILKRFACKLKKIMGPVALKLVGTLVDKLYHTKTRFVFSVGKNELPQFKTIVYNALGGSNLLKSDVVLSKKALKILSSVDFISVRDDDTSLALGKAGISHELCPDTAILMSDIFSENFLLSKLSVDSKMFKDKQYIIFQGNLNTWRNKYEIAAQQIEKIYFKFKVPICLCPIGTAIGHSDDVALERIAEQIHEKNAFVIVDNPNIFDIMWLIKHSKMYIGSSLHGVITSMSFNVPYVGYGGRKQIAYIEKWADYNVKTAVCSNFYDVALLNIGLSICSDNQKRLVKEVLGNILNFYK